MPSPEDILLQQPQRRRIEAPSIETVTYTMVPARYCTYK